MTHPVFLLQMFPSYTVHYLLKPQNLLLVLQMRPATLLVLNTFSIGTTSVTFLITQTFSSHHTPSFPTADVTLLILYTVSSHCTTFSLFCRFDPSGRAHFLYSHCRCEIPDNVDFLLQPHTLSSYSRCSFSDTVYLLLTLYCTTFSSHRTNFSWYRTLSLCVLQMSHSSYYRLSPLITHPVFLLYMFPSYTVHFLPYCTTFSSYCRCDPPGTEHFLYSYSRCDISDTADFLVTPHTMSFCYRCTFL